MKLKNGFVLREIAGECVVVAVDKTLNFDGMITLNETAKTIWLLLEKGAEIDEIVKVLTGEYDVSDEIAREAVESFVGRLTELEFLE